MTTTDYPQLTQNFRPPSDVPYQMAVQDIEGKDQFSLFIPPGTKEVTLTLFVPQDAQIGAAARIKTAPSGQYGDDYTTVDWIKSDNGADVFQLQNADYLSKNYGGHITMVNDRAIARRDQELYQNGWRLYVKVLSFDQQQVQSMSFMAMITDAVLYKDWYDKGQPV